jgi:hypothetical protein
MRLRWPTASVSRPAGAAGSFSEPLAIASWILRIAVLLHAVGRFASVFSMRHTLFGNLLFIEIFDQRLQVADPYMSAVFVEKITVTLYLAAGLLVLFRPWWPLLLLMGGYALLEAVSGTIIAGYRFSEWTVPAYALRFGAPFALLALTAFPRAGVLERWRLPMTVGLLRMAIATVFVMHGLQALWADPQFIDLIIGSGRRLLGVRITEADAIMCLKVIGVADLAVALALVIYPVPMFVPRALWANPCAVCPIRRTIMPLLLGWAAMWGLVTAASRMTSLGWSSGLPQYPELLDRASHFLGPLALWYLYAAADRPPACSGPDLKTPEERTAGPTPEAARSTLSE